eukprot:706492-Hanusia_phi.AAC.4
MQTNVVELKEVVPRGLQRLREREQQLGRNRVGPEVQRGQAREQARVLQEEANPAISQLRLLQLERLEVGHAGNPEGLQSAISDRAAADVQGRQTGQDGAAVCREEGTVLTRQGRDLQSDKLPRASHPLGDVAQSNCHFLRSGGVFVCGHTCSHFQSVFKPSPPPRSDPLAATLSPSEDGSLLRLSSARSPCAPANHCQGDRRICRSGSAARPIGL